MQSSWGRHNLTHIKNKDIFLSILSIRNRNYFLEFLLIACISTGCYYITKITQTICVLACILKCAGNEQWLSYTIYLSKKFNMKLFCRKEHKKVKSINQSLSPFSCCMSLFLSLMISLFTLESSLPRLFLLPLVLNILPSGK